MNAFMWALLTAFIWGMVPVMEKLGLSKIDPFTALFYRCVGVLLGVLFLGVFVVKPEQLKAVDTKAVILLISAGLLASFVAQITFYHGLKIGQVSRVVPVSGSYPLIAFLLSMLILKEPLNAEKVLGMVLVISGVWFLR